MSKILASIADAERLAGYDPDCNLIDGTCERATAARAEYAEIVAAWKVLVSTSEEDMTCNDEDCRCREAFAKLDSLLSRVGGGA